MVVAQVLITIMVVQWLSMQYRDKRDALEKELSQAWTGAHQQMIDSMLMKQYILPAIDSAEARHFTFKFMSDSKDINVVTRSIDSGNVSVITGTGAVSKDHVAAAREEDADARNHMRIERDASDRDHVRVETESDITKDLVLRGVKLFVNVQSDSLNHIGHGKDVLMPDTSVLKSAFRQKLQMLNPRFVITWDTAVNEDTARRASGFTYTAVVNDLDIRADIKGSAVVLIPEIMPQVLFALLLIVITASAFLISYRSLRAQMIMDVQRNDFIHNMSHEIRTPVSTVKVALEALKNFDRSNDPAIMKEYLEMATHETNRLEQLVSRVTDLSTDSAPVAVNFKEEDLNQVIIDVLQSMKPRLEGEKAIVNFERRTQPVIVLMDKLHIHGVLINLIDNSLKYSAAPAQIDIYIEQKADMVSIIVADKGVGIPDQYHDRIFEKFFRVPTGDLHNIKGYGLGLSYASMIMKQHHGDIAYNPREGGGSEIILTIPKRGKA